MWELRNPIKTPLTLLTMMFGYTVLKGMFGWEAEDEVLFFVGMTQLVAIIWMWVVYDRRM